MSERLTDRQLQCLRLSATMTDKDIDMIVTSTEKVTKRGQKIEALELGAAEADTVSPKSEPALESAAMSRTGQLRLRVVEGDE